MTDRIEDRVEHGAAPEKLTPAIVGSRARPGQGEPDGRRPSEENGKTAGSGLASRCFLT
jgi:hypothetical protein